jgi:hypothetical protein
MSFYLKGKAGFPQILLDLSREKAGPVEPFSTVQVILSG